MAAVCVLMFALMMGLLSCGSSLESGLSSTTIVPTATNRPPMLPKFSFDLLKKWILEHPIKIGLSVAVIILSVLLCCMCCLWTCKRRERIIYYVDEGSDLEEEEKDEGEVHCNPDATSETAEGEPDTEDDIDSGISGSGENKRRRIAPELSPATVAASAEVILELKAAVQQQGPAVAEENTTESSQVEPSHKETVISAELYEEIPRLDSFFIDWPGPVVSGLPSLLSDWASPATVEHSGSLNLSEISDIA